jgi:hypothetical protein
MLQLLLSASADSFLESSLVPNTQLSLLPPKLIQRVLQLNLLQRQQLQKWVQLAAQSLLKSHYFALSQEYRVLATEQKLEWPAPFRVFGVQLEGRLDVLLEHKQSKSLLLIDFKTSRRRLNDLDCEKAQRYFAKSLQPSQENLLRPFWVKEIELQLPLYALMLRSSFVESPITMALQFLRPPLYGPAHFLTQVLAECIESEPIWEQVIVEHVFNPLLKGFSYDEWTARQAFLPNYDAQRCRRCPYSGICEQTNGGNKECDVLEEVND